MSDFARINELGGEKIGKIKSLLDDGIEPLHVAELIQSEWGDFGDVSQAMVVQFINRWYKQVKKELAEGEPIPMLEVEEFDPLKEILALAKQQRARIDRTLEKEKEVGMLIPGTGAALKEYQETLALMQRMQIEQELARGKIKPLTAGMSLTDRIKEAIGASERVMNKGYDNG